MATPIRFFWTDGTGSAGPASPQGRSGSSCGNSSGPGNPESMWPILIRFGSGSGRQSCRPVAVRRIITQIREGERRPSARRRSTVIRTAAWLAERRAELLPVPYFHVVFTLPAPTRR
jgi:hypothetical protein